MSDPISDLIVRIKNALEAGHIDVVMPYSKFKMAVLEVIQKNGFIQEFESKNNKDNKDIVIKFGNTSISHIKRLSKPGQRIYVSKRDIPRPLRGLGLIVLSTPKGVISGKEAIRLNTGGELICEVW